VFDQARKYAWYYLNAKSKHGVHSPFVFDLVTRVFEDKEVYPEYKDVERIRMGMLSSRLVTEVKDYGAGAEGKKPVYEKRVSEIAAKSSKPARWGKLLYRLCRYFQFRNMLELGTSLGISSSYQALGALSVSGDIRFTTIEGSPALAALAAVNHEELKIKDHVRIVTGNFDDVLKEVVDSYESLDYVFIDGNHRKEPTLRYFDQVLQKCHNDTVLVFDDIYWSSEMAEAWESIRQHPQVTVTVDLFYLGLVFLRKEQAKENFVIRF
jgi:predicted O-methyltransferase YrrM